MSTTGMKAFFVLLVFSALATGVCVNGNPSVQDEYNSSKLVLIGKAVAGRKTPGSTDGFFLEGDTFKVIPTRIFKGGAARSIELFSENSSGRFPMQLHREYLLFIYDNDGRFLVDNCGNSGPLSASKNLVTEVAKLSHR